MAEHCSDLKMTELFWKMVEHYRKMADTISRMVEKWLSIVAIKKCLSTVSIRNG
jgi:hypothetical protein